MNSVRLAERVAAALKIREAHLASTPGERVQYRCDCVACDMGRALAPAAGQSSTSAKEN